LTLRGVRGDVEQFTQERARAGVACDVAHGVAAALPAREADLAQLTDHHRHRRQRDVVDLDVLPGRDVTLAQRRVFLDRVGERVKLIGRHAPHWQLHADHLDVCLTLAVDTLTQAKLRELVVLQLASQKLPGLRVEVVELVLDDRDHVPGNVLEHLGTLERTLLRPAVSVLLSFQRGVRWHQFPLGCRA
jgi:hypothetical protein